MKNVQRLRDLAEGTNILYVEDNDGLREKTTQLLSRFFHEVYVAEDGLKGLELYKKHQPHIVITDLRMPKLDGFSMCEKILAINPSVKFIITTAHDEKEYLMQAIEYGVFRFLKKPLVIEYFVDALVDCLSKEEDIQHVATFENEITKIFNYHNNLLVLMKKQTPVFANPKFYEFFGVDDLEQFMAKYKDFGAIFHEHLGFVFTQLSITWYDQLTNSGSELFHAKLKSVTGEYRHCILKVHQIPEVQDEYILSFDDITELGMMDIFIDKKEKENKGHQKIGAAQLERLLDMVKNNHSKVGLLNFYRGLTIANDASIVSHNEKNVTFKSSYFQLKIIRQEGVTTIRSDFFPKDIRATCEAVDFDMQVVILKDLAFVDASGTMRKHVRVEPEDSQVSMVHQGKKYEAEIVDISTHAMKIVLPMLPPKFIEGSEVVVSVEIPLSTSPIQFTCKAKLLRIDHLKKEFHAVLLTELSKEEEKVLLGYIPKRQMELIREFKSLELKE